MELCTCRMCGFSFYKRIETNLCDDCAKKSEDMYDKIVRYLKEYPNSNALQISDYLNIPAYDVLTFLDNGQLERSNGVFEQIPDEPDFRLRGIPKNPD